MGFVNVSVCVCRVRCLFTAEVRERGHRHLLRDIAFFCLWFDNRDTGVAVASVLLSAVSCDNPRSSDLPSLWQMHTPTSFHPGVKKYVQPVSQKGVSQIVYISKGSFPFTHQDVFCTRTMYTTTTIKGLILMICFVTLCPGSDLTSLGFKWI